MADKIHKKKKNWPHFEKMYVGGEKYADGWERIFGKKKKAKSKKKVEK